MLVKKSSKDDNTLAILEGNPIQTGEGRENLQNGSLQTKRS
jgi:hypothetical protein